MDAMKERLAHGRIREIESLSVVLEDVTEVIAKSVVVGISSLDNTSHQIQCKVEGKFG
jgi:hypothetical protein